MTTPPETRPVQSSTSRFPMLIDSSSMNPMER